VSRARVKWGIPVPEQPDHVLYVWVDALSNYVTALGLGETDPVKRKPYEHWWAFGDAPPGERAERMHLIGKDIIRFHCLYWPAILHAAGLPVPTRLFAQGWITQNGKKLSKTTGNVIDPVQLVNQYGSDAVRYFLLREGTYGQDWDFTDGAFVTRFNADLANDLGNLVSRALTMVRNYCGGRVPQAGETRQLESGDLQRQVFQSYERLDFSAALAEIWSWVGRLNGGIVDFEPWVAAKDPARRPELDSFLYRLLEEIRLIAVLASPVIPRAAGRICRMLGLEPRALSRTDLDWGQLEPGRPLGVIEPLFPRLEKKEKAVSESKPPPPSAAPSTSAPAAAPSGDKIDIADFAKVELRVAQVKEAERIAGSKKLLKLQVDLGTETRQVVAGIAETYAPETLVGKKIALVTNLKAAKLMGVESHGMVLAASLDGKAVLCSFDADVPAGTRIK